MILIFCFLKSFMLICNCWIDSKPSRYQWRNWTCIDVVKFKNQIVNTQALHTGNHVELMDCGATVRDRCSFKHRGWTSRRTRSAHPSQIPINDHRVQAFVPKACTSCRFFAQCFAREAVLFVPPFGKDKSFIIVTLGARTCLITPLSNHRFSATPLIHR